MFVFVCIIAFIISFVGSIAFKMLYTPRELRKYTVNWNDEIGKAYTDFSYGNGAANKFDLYVPSDNSKETYGLIVYLHAGGFRTGDKSDDAKMLQWLCSLGYVTAGINYTLNSDENPDTNVYTMSMEIKESIPYVIEEAKKLGYNIDRMAMSGGSAGGCLALIYAYRDAKDSPVPVKMVFEGVSIQRTGKAMALIKTPKRQQHFSAICAERRSHLIYSEQMLTMKQCGMCLHFCGLMKILSRQLWRMERMIHSSLMTPP